MLFDIVKFQVFNFNTCEKRPLLKFWANRIVSQQHTKSPSNSKRNRELCPLLLTFLNKKHWGHVKDMSCRNLSRTHPPRHLLPMLPSPARGGHHCKNDQRRFHSNSLCEDVWRWDWHFKRFRTFSLANAWICCSNLSKKQDMYRYMNYLAL